MELDITKAAKISKQDTQKKPLPKHQVTNMLRKGFELFQQGDRNSAKQIMEEILETNPDNAIAWSNLAGFYLSQNQLAEAIAPLRQAVKYDPTDALNHFNLGLALSSTKQLDEAESIFHRTLPLVTQTSAPSRSDVLIQLAVVLKAKNQYQEAHQRIQESLEIAPPNWQLQAEAQTLLLDVSRNLPNKQGHKKPYHVVIVNSKDNKPLLKANLELSDLSFLYYPFAWDTLFIQLFDTGFRTEVWTQGGVRRPMIDIPAKLFSQAEKVCDGFIQTIMTLVTSQNWHWINATVRNEKIVLEFQDQEQEKCEVGIHIAMRYYPAKEPTGRSESIELELEFYLSASTSDLHSQVTSHLQSQFNPQRYGEHFNPLVFEKSTVKSPYPHSSTSSLFAIHRTITTIQEGSIGFFREEAQSYGKDKVQELCDIAILMSKKKRSQLALKILHLALEKGSNNVATNIFAVLDGQITDPALWYNLSNLFKRYQHESEAEKAASYAGDYQPPNEE